MRKNKSWNFWRSLKITFRVWFGCGLMASLYIVLLTSCSSTVTGSDGELLISMPEVQDDKSFDRVRLDEAIRLWEAESGELGDSFSAGKAAYDIASVTHDPKWANEAIDRLAEAREVLPDFAQATAYQGSAHALVARDFPLQGIWMLLPGPGFVRIWYVKRAEELLNKAVEQNGDDPVVRLFRAATMSSMPQILLTDGGVADTDFALLERWEADPKLNSEYEDILNSDKWRKAFYEAYAEQLSENQREDEAENYRTKLIELEE
jgi:hypothetical protein